MSNKLFVGGLSWDTTSDDLRRAFEGFCSVADVKVISDRDTGRSRGFYKKFGVSRIMLRELALAGHLPGVRKSSW